MVKASLKNGISTITARGELDRFDFPVLRAEFERAPSGVLLDLLGVGFIDSRCARMVSDEADRVRRRGDWFKLEASPQVLKTLNILDRAGLKTARDLVGELKTPRLALA